METSDYSANIFTISHDPPMDTDLHKGSLSVLHFAIILTKNEHLQNLQIDLRSIKAYEKGPIQNAKIIAGLLLKSNGGIVVENVDSHQDSLSIDDGHYEEVDISDSPAIMICHHRPTAATRKAI